MSAPKQLALPRLECYVCGDEIVIPAAITSRGALCADCGAPTCVEVAGCVRREGHEGFHTTVPAIAAKQDAADAVAVAATVDVAKEPEAPTYTKPTHDGVRSATDTLAEGPRPENNGEVVDNAPGDRAASVSPESLLGWRFSPPRQAAMLSIDVEEWLFAEPVVRGGDPRLVSTPRDFYAWSLSEEALLLTPPPGLARFMVVMDWRSHVDQLIPFRDIGPAFIPQTVADRATALNAARDFAIAEAKRLGAVGPYGYQPAREVR